jgi:hypothetical protein
MPTTRRRHAVTETPRVQAALDELRRELGTDRVEMGELVVLGAETKVAALRAERARQDAAVRSLAEMIRSRDVLVDQAAADEVRATGWTRE